MLRVTTNQRTNRVVAVHLDENGTVTTDEYINILKRQYLHVQKNYNKLVLSAVRKYPYLVNHIQDEYSDYTAKVSRLKTFDENIVNQCVVYNNI